MLLLLLVVLLLPMRLLPTSCDEAAVAAGSPTGHVFLSPPFLHTSDRRCPVWRVSAAGSSSVITRGLPLDKITHRLCCLHEVLTRPGTGFCNLDLCLRKLGG